MLLFWPCPIGWVLILHWSLLQPERINPELNQKGYNVKSDVWSLGITMVPSGLGPTRAGRVGPCSVVSFWRACHLVRALEESVIFTVRGENLPYTMTVY